MNKSHFYRISQITLKSLIIQFHFLVLCHLDVWVFISESNWFTWAVKGGTKALFGVSAICSGREPAVVERVPLFYQKARQLFEVRSKKERQESVSLLYAYEVYTLPKRLKCRSSSSLDETYSNEHIFQGTLLLYLMLVDVMYVCREDSGTESYFVGTYHEFALETKYLFTNGPQRAILRPVWPGMARFTNMTWCPTSPLPYPYTVTFTSDTS